WWWSRSFPALRPEKFRSMRCWLALSAAALLLCGCALAKLVRGTPDAPPPRPALDPDLVQRGAVLFSDARLSGDRSRACSTCHPGGGADHEVYAGGEPVPAGTPSGRRTLPLRGLWQTAPYLWDGSAPTVSDAVERMLAVEMRHGTLAGREREALVAYLLSLQPFDRGRVQPDGAPTEPTTLAARRGFGVFEQAKCVRCHPGPAFATSGLEDVGTGGEFAVPTLRGVSAGGPYGHDGRWPDLESAVRAIATAKKVELTPDEMSQLLAYLKLL
ncbi:MAG: cytochrome c peroxidase, partial [bacterium]